MGYLPAAKDATNPIVLLGFYKKRKRSPVQPALVRLIRLYYGPCQVPKYESK
jgi:hypothetical protein